MDPIDENIEKMREVCRESQGVFRRGESWGGLSGAECVVDGLRVGIAGDGETSNYTIENMDGEFGLLTNVSGVDGFWTTPSGIVDDGSDARKSEFTFNSDPTTPQNWLVRVDEEEDFSR